MKKYLSAILFFPCISGCGVLFSPPFDINGRWLVDFSGDASSFCLTMTDGMATSWLGGCSNATLVSSALPATVDGNSVEFGFTSNALDVLSDGTLISVEVTLLFTGAIQGDGSIAGIVGVFGNVNGQSEFNSLVFTMNRLQ